MGEKIQTDVIVIGSGIAGLSFARYLDPSLEVRILTKKKSRESNTNYAQGGIAAVTSRDDHPKLHWEDTLAAGAGLCDADAVQILVEEGPDRVRELFELGFPFTKSGDGTMPELGREGGHSKNRIVHAKDATGRMVEKELLKLVVRRRKTFIHEYAHAIDLATSWHAGLPTEKNRILGVYVYDAGLDDVVTYEAPVVFLASGGAGRVYKFTTNPEIATGDGIGMGYRAGCQVCNMEFYQFHPTSLYTQRQLPRSFLISEAVRGAGGILRTSDGRAFMEDYHELKDLAPRDIVARGIDAECKRSGTEHVYLDVTHLPPEEIEEDFPLIFNTCLDEFGIDIRKDWIPVVPAAHYMNGGVMTDYHGRTDIAGLLASGEVSWTGVHGANRLASNSLLEGLVFSHRAAHFVSENIERLRDEQPVAGAAPWRDTSKRTENDALLIQTNRMEIREIMNSYVGIVRSNRHLKLALKKIDLIYNEIRDIYNINRVTPEVIELRNMVLTAQLIIRSALMRKESRGLHFSEDYPQTGEPVNTILQNRQVVRPPV